MLVTFPVFQGRPSTDWKLVGKRCSDLRLSVLTPVRERLLHVANIIVEGKYDVMQQPPCMSTHKLCLVYR